LKAKQDAFKADLKTWTAQAENEENVDPASMLDPNTQQQQTPLTENNGAKKGKGKGKGKGKEKADAYQEPQQYSASHPGQYSTK
jgi:hypothetical protein